MRHRIIVILLLVPFTTGCPGSSPKTTEADRTKAAILRVLQTDNELSKKFKNLPPNSTPSQIAWGVGEYCNDLERLEMSDCPADFRVAYRHHISAWREAQAAIKQLPDGFLEGLFLGAMNGLLRNERDGGTGRWEGGVRRALERVRDSWFEVEKIGAKYGAAL